MWWLYYQNNTGCEPFFTKEVKSSCEPTRPILNPQGSEKTQKEAFMDGCRIEGYMWVGGWDWTSPSWAMPSTSTFVANNRDAYSNTILLRGARILGFALR